MTKVIMYRIQKTYSVHCKNATYAPTFLGYNNSVLALVECEVVIDVFRVFWDNVIT